MGQSLKKLTGGVDDAESKKALESLINKVIEERYKILGGDTENWSKAKFYHAVYKIVEGVNDQKGGAIQFKMPSTEDLEKVFKTCHSGDGLLTKEEFAKIMKEVMKLQNISVGQGAKDTLLYIFGIPIVALIAKRQLPLPTRAISDDVFIPAVTSATVVCLAMANKI